METSKAFYLRAVALEGNVRKRREDTNSACAKNKCQICYNQIRNAIQDLVIAEKMQQSQMELEILNNKENITNHQDEI